jgi:hypothetical protein
MRPTWAVAAAISTMFAASAAAQEKMTVQSLIGQDFQVVASIFNQGSGTSVFLQKKDKLYFCALLETPNSPDLSTRYCKPVH